MFLSLLPKPELSANQALNANFWNQLEPCYILALFRRLPQCLILGFFKESLILLKLVDLLVAALVRNSLSSPNCFAHNPLSGINPL